MLVGDKSSVPGHVFISYVRENAREVDTLQRSLELAGIRVWRDKVDVWPGDIWRSVIREAITQNALVFIACFSKESAARHKSYQNEELKLAVAEIRLRPQGEPWLIPVRLSDCEIPDDDIGGGTTLRSIHWVDLFGADAEIGEMRLVNAVRRILLRHQDGPPLAPVEQLLKDAQDLGDDEMLPEEVAARLVPGFCRLAVEAAFTDAAIRTQLRAGRQRAQVEQDVEAAGTLNQRAALAMFGSAAFGFDVQPRLRGWSPAAADTYKSLNRGIHHGYSGSLPSLLSDTRALLTLIGEKLR